MTTVLFLCVANAGRSQVAEALARRLAPPSFTFYSAGSHPGRAVNPFAQAALAEIGIDVSAARTKGLEDVPLAEVDTIVTLCAEEVCPVVPGNVRRLHWPLLDPKSPEDFRAVRDRLTELLPGLWAGSPDRA